MPGQPHRPIPIPVKDRPLDDKGRLSIEFVRYLLQAPKEGYEGTGGKVPVGTIVMYGKAVIDIPYGWDICDGNNGTPNLVEKFILGTATEAEIGQTGGYAAPQMPAHVHTQTSHTHTITHTHPIAHTHTIGTHVHTQTSHTHTIATHTHTIAHTHDMWHNHTINQHTHTIDHNHPQTAADQVYTHHIQTDYTMDTAYGTTGGTDGWSPWIHSGNGNDSPSLQEGSGLRLEGSIPQVNISDYSGSSGNTSLTTNGGSIDTTGGASTPSTGAASTPNTGGATSANTGAASTPNTGGTSTANTGASSAPNTGGATAANTGSTGAGDETLGNYPPYYKLIYIMRTL